MNTLLPFNAHSWDFWRSIIYRKSPFMENTEYTGIEDNPNNKPKHEDLLVNIK